MFRLKDLLQLNDDFKQIKVLAGKKGLDNEITDIQPLEVPDGSFWAVRGRIMLSTGYLFKNNTVLFRESINICYEKQAAGFAIKVGRYMKSIPQEIIELCDELGFPIMDIPVHIPYSNLIWPVISKLLNNKAHHSYVIEKVQNRVHQLASYEYDLDKFFEILTSYIDCSAILLSKYEETLYFKSSSSGNSKNVNNQLIHNLIDKNHDLILSTNSIAVIHKGNKYYLVHAMKSPEGLLGYFCCIIDTGQYKDIDFIKHIVEILIPYILVWLLTSDVIRTEYKQQDLLLDLVLGKYVLNRDFYRKLKQFNLEVESNFFITIVDVASELDGTRLHEISDLLSKEFPPNISFTDNSQIVFIIFIDDHVYYQMLVKNCYRYITEKYNRSELITGVSLPHDNLLEAKYAYQEALFCINNGPLFAPHKDGFYSYNTLTSYHLVSELSEHSVTQNLYNNVVAKLREYDRINNSELVRTLVAYVNSGLNISETAQKELFIHRNTLYKRLEKIEDLVGYSFDTIEGKLIYTFITRLDEFPKDHFSV